MEQQLRVIKHLLREISELERPFEVAAPPTRWVDHNDAALLGFQAKRPQLAILFFRASFHFAGSFPLGDSRGDRPLLRTS